MQTTNRASAEFDGSLKILRSWLLGPTATLWLDCGIDRAGGGFFDQLSFSSARNACDFKRLRVCARQIFVFAQLAEWGVGGTHEAVLHGLDFLLGRLRHPEGGFISATTLTGAPLNDKRDLYDHAFVLFALASAYKLTRDPALLTEARGLLDLLRQAMAHSAGGFVEALPSELPRRQNPHMHLLEACLAWIPLVADTAFADLAKDLLALFANRFFDPAHGALFEYFDDDLRLSTDPGQHQYEPGHHFEWVWLLGQARRLGLAEPETSVGQARLLAETASSKGFASATGLPYGALQVDGTIANSTCRIWVVTEWLRACLDEPGSGVGPAQPAIDHLRRFLDVPLVGLWHERCDATTGRFDIEPVPASSLYHIVSALIPVIDALNTPSVNGIVQV